MNEPKISSSLAIYKYIVFLFIHKNKSKLACFYCIYVSMSLKYVKNMTYYGNFGYGIVIDYTATVIEI